MALSWTTVVDGTKAASPFSPNKLLSGQVAKVYPGCKGKRKLFDEVRKELQQERKQNAAKAAEEKQAAERARKEAEKAAAAAAVGLKVMQRREKWAMLKLGNVLITSGKCSSQKEIVAYLREYMPGMSKLSESTWSDWQISSIVDQQLCEDQIKEEMKVLSTLKDQLVAFAKKGAIRSVTMCHQIACCLCEQEHIQPLLAPPATAP